MLHQTAVKGFLRPDIYDQSRPEYPADAVARLGYELKLTSSSVVVELGAGTGKFTRLLAQAAPSGARIVAIEPIENMRRKFATLLPSIELLDGTAERLPLPDSSAEAVVAAQAFHWFDYAKALPEISRVLRPGRMLGLIWNIRDDSIDWVARLEEITHPHSYVSPRYVSDEWRRAVEASGLFSRLGCYESRHAHPGGPETVIERVASSSYIACLPQDEKSRVLEQVHHLLATHPQTAGKATVPFPYRTPVYWCASSKRG